MEWREAKLLTSPPCSRYSVGQGCGGEDFGVHPEIAKVRGETSTDPKMAQEG